MRIFQNHEIRKIKSHEKFSYFVVQVFMKKDNEFLIMSFDRYLMCNWKDITCNVIYLLEKSFHPSLYVGCLVTQV